MKFGDFTDRLMPLLEDANVAETLLDTDDSQFNRRAYVRSVFAMIEGTVWILKQLVLEAPAAPGLTKTLSVGEYALLADRSFDLSSGGEVRQQTKYLKLSENLRFTFRTAGKYFRVSFDLQIGKAPWNSFLMAQAIRNRITHPKARADYTITDDELQRVRDTCSWFNTLLWSFAEGIVGNTAATRY
jgi:hypothetical protein